MTHTLKRQESMFTTIAHLFKDMGNDLRMMAIIGKIQQELKGKTDVFSYSILKAIAKGENEEVIKTIKEQISCGYKGLSEKLLDDIKNY